jgi:DNA-directed RNA polymerase subunit H (RpoH/RPB5)
MSSNASLVYRSRQILCRLMEARGKDTSSYHGESIQVVENMVHNDDVKMEFDNIRVVYYLGKGIRDSHIRNFIEETELTPEQEMIVVLVTNPNDTIRKFQEYIYHTENLFVNVMYIRNLQFNILEHSLVPKHIILSEEEKKKVCEQYSITNYNQFPEISRFDPVSEAIGLQPDTLCRIIRNSKTAIQSEYFRMCI